MADTPEKMSSVEEIQRRKNEMLQCLKQVAAATGGIGHSVPAEILIPITCALAQWEIALQLALYNEKNDITLATRTVGKALAALLVAFLLLFASAQPAAAQTRVSLTTKVTESERQPKTGWRYIRGACDEQTRCRVEASDDGQQWTTVAVMHTKDPITKSQVYFAAIPPSAEPTARYRHPAGVALNDLAVTPGAIRTTDRNLICNGGSTKNIRNVTLAQKRAVYHAYHAVKKPGACCEVDHLISLELGGSNDTANLWPQPYLPRPGAHEKDVLENYLHAEICAGRIAPADAQHAIATDWYVAYLEMKKKEGSK